MSHSSSVCLLLLLACSFGHASAAVQWQRCYGGVSIETCAVAKQTSDGGFVLSGSSSSAPSGNKTAQNYGSADYWIVKADATGTPEWDASFGSTNADYLHGISQVHDGYLLAGYSVAGISGNKTNAGFRFEDYWVIKLDSAGRKVWERSFGGNDYDELRSAQPTRDGGYILVGLSASPASGNKSSPNFGGYDGWVVKISSDGLKEWDKSFGGESYDDLYTAQQTSDGGYILAGVSYSSPSGNKDSPFFGGLGDLWLVKVDASGTKLWDKSFGGTGDESAAFAIETSDGGYILAGDSNSGISGNKQVATSGGYDYWVLKLDIDGTKLWEKTFGGTNDEHLAAIRQTSDGGFLLAGTSRSDISGNKTCANINSNGIPSDDYWIVKVDSTGNTQWQQSYGGTASDSLASAEISSDGGILLAGTSYSVPSGNKTAAAFANGDLWAIKLAPDAPWLSAPFFQSNCVHLRVSASPTANCVLQGSADSLHWLSLVTNNSDSGIMDFKTGSTNFGNAALYRVMQLQ